MKLIHLSDGSPVSVEGAGGGGKGASGRTPTEAADSLFADATVYVIDVVSEGEIEGWLDPDHPARNILFDGTPIENPDGSLNFEGVQFTLRTGTPDQEPVPGFGQVESETAVNLEVKAATSVSRSITDADTDAVRLSIHVPQLAVRQSNGDLVGGSVTFAIDIQAGSDPTETVLTDTIDGKTTSGYTRQWRIDLPPTRPVSVTVRRVTPDSESTLVTDAIFWQSYTEIIDAKLTYPDTAYVALAIPADSVGNRLPVRTYRLRGVKCLIPSNYDPETRDYDGVWDGTFQRAYTDNPAWVLYTALVDGRWGVGERVDPSAIDKWSFYDASVYNDELVPDGLGGTEPRFTCNGPLTERTASYNALTELAGVMRAQLYWGAGAIVLAQDRPRDPVKLVTNASAIGGEFNYPGSARAARHSAASAAFRDPSDRYALKRSVAYDEAEAIERWGWREADVSLNYEVRRGAAVRALKWLVDTDQTATETLAYKAGFDHAGIRPGDAVLISDKHRIGRRVAGRLRAVEAERLRLDQAVEFSSSGVYSITVSTPSGGFVELPLASGLSGPLEWVDLDTPIEVGSLKAGANFALTGAAIEPRRFRVLANKPVDHEFEIIGIIEDPAKWDRVEQGIDATAIAPYILAPSGPLAAPVEIAVDELLYRDGSAVRAAIDISVTPPADARVYLLELGVREPGATSWSPMGVQTSRVWRRQPIIPGLYAFRARAIDSLGRPGAWRQVEIAVLGLLAPPGTPASMSVSVSGAAATVRWAEVDDLDLRAYEILHSGDVGASVASAQRVALIAAPSNMTTAPALSGRWFLRAVDAQGIRGAAASAVVTEAAQLEGFNAVELVEGGPDWDGESVDAVEINDALELSAAALVADWDLIANVGLLRLEGGLASEGVFEFAERVDLGEVYPVRVSASVSAFGVSLSNLVSEWGLLSELGFLTGADPDQWSVRIEFRQSDSSPEDADAGELWSEWSELIAGELQARSFDQRLRLTSYAAGVSPHVTRAEILYDMPDRVAGQTNVTAPAEGLRIDYAPAFRARPALAVDGQGLSAGDRKSVTNQSETGFDVQFFDFSGTPVERTFDWLAKGYGRKA